MLNEYGYEPAFLPAIVPADYIKRITGTQATDEQLEAAASQASAMVRSYCGWHVSPPMRCTYDTECAGFPEIQLPATVVTHVESVTVDGVPVDFMWKPNGRVARKGMAPWPSEWGSVRVVYEAGVDESAFSQMVAKMSAAALASPAGVRSESVGSASITYATTEAELSQRQSAYLDAYRLKARP